MRTPLELLLLVSACTAAPAAGPAHDASPVPAAAPMSSTSSVVPNWKERLEQPYLYRDHVGDYRELPGALRELLENSAARDRSGAAFVLFYDDPRRVPVAELRARVCIPVAQRPDALAGLRYDVLPRALVAYAHVESGEAAAARSYPALFAYMQELGWPAGIPVREIYRGLDDAGAPTEVQIPRAESTP